MDSHREQRVRLGDFEIALSSAKVFRNGVSVNLEPQPFRVLEILIQRPGEIISREELRDRIWGRSTFVEFDQGLSYCIRRIRRALNDSSAHPKYIETLPKQGYRLVASVEYEPARTDEPAASTRLASDTALLGREANGAEPGNRSRLSPFLTRRTVAWSAGVSLITASGAWLLTLSLRRNPTRPIRLVIELPAGAAAADPGRLLGPPVVAPDGSSLVVTLQTASGSFLYIRPLEADQLIRMEGTQGASFPFWSPDGKMVAFFAEDRLKVVSKQGGGPTVLCAALQARGGAWSHRGVILFSAVRGARNLQELSLIRVSGGTSMPVSHLDGKAGENSHRYPQFLPDGNQFLYFSRSDNLDVRGVYLSSVDQKERRLRMSVADGLFSVASNGNDGRPYLFSQQGGKLIAQRLDLRRAELSADHWVVMEHPASFSVSNSGILAARTEEQELTQLSWRDRDGNQISKYGPRGDYWSLSLSPNDRYVTVIQHNFLNGEFTAWLSSTNRADFEPLSNSRHVENPFWLADGVTVYFTDFRKKRLLFRTVSPQGEERLAAAVSDGVRVQDISADHKYVVSQLFQTPDEGQVGLSVFPVGGGLMGEWRTIAAQGYGERHPTFSPDGKWLAFASDESGGSQVYVADFPSMRSRMRISRDGGTSPRWRRDGRELFYLSSDGYLMAVDITDNKPWGEREAKKLFAAHTRLAKNTGRLYDATSNGQRFLIIEGAPQPNETRLEVILNWPSLLPS